MSQQTAATNETANTKTETPPGSKKSLRDLPTEDLRNVLAIARDRETPLVAREAALAGYEIPSSMFAPDPGVADKIGNVTSRALFALIGTAAASAAIVVIVSSIKSILGKGATPAPTEPGGAKLHLPPT